MSTTIRAGGALATVRRETRASYAFVERNINLTKRYWGWEIAFLIYSAAASMSIMFIGKAQGGDEQTQLILFLAIGTLVWSFLNSVFMNMAEMIAIERWEGTIEYTMMAPISRLTHMFGQSVFSIVYGIIRSALLLGVLALFFDINLAGANLLGGLLVVVVGSLSFVGFGIMAAVLPLLFPEKGEQMTFIISSILLLVSGVYYPTDVLPGWMQVLSTLSPATYVLEAMRSALLDGASTLDLLPKMLPMLLIGVVTVPLGLVVFGYFERYAKRTGRLKRSG
ncbi:MAG: ABC transporter [Chloroflexi bacterium]|nr:MAG: ABC transporter [Chloroflexota bacterium]